MLPNFLIIGAARCGTTWIGKNLMIHPEIFMPSIKEVHFFDNQYGKGISWYESFFSEATQKIIGEATPGYLYSEQAPELIKKHLPDSKLIVCLRDPVDRAYSHFWYREHERRAANESVSFEEKISWSSTPNSTNEGMPRLLEESLYSQKLSKYLDLFPRQNILILFYDDLKNDPTKFLQEIYSFIGADKNFKSQLVDKQLNTSASKIGKSRLLFHAQKLLNKLNLFGLASSIDKVNRNEIPPIKKELRQMLLDKYYLEDIQKLEVLVGRDLSKWKKY